MGTRRLLAASLSVAALSSGTLTALAAAAPQEARALCAGSTMYFDSLVVDGRDLVSEKPFPAVCNGDGTYEGVFAARQSGWTAYVVRHDNGQTRTFSGRLYPDSASYQYQDGNRSSYTILCANRPGDSICGFGSKYVRVRGDNSLNRAILQAIAIGYEYRNWGF
ncbi:hypothetical protein [Actinomadura rudentiformis]|uniref:Uncharacterized protein n=1 Tax=Actinomadura rudentiformis TaxID=359158 RepID=A0A6H9Z813_9ACTN|nr:hypothetical protein [Actinomadura rudentiformis]KAB2350066.1 hypothetical protein F8566_09610 [Actinomadura rudentiformis]